jgi:tungstate transport system substrate-binding protein
LASEQEGKALKKLIDFLAVATLVGIVFAAAVTLAGCSSGKPTAVILATTTSTQDSGLLDHLLPVFDKKFNHKTKTIAVGTGEALKMGERGDADVVLVHALAAEEAFVKAGFGLERVQVMYNDFIVIGPQSDPAGIKGDKSAVDAFKKIATAGAAGKTVFVSRGDASGTNAAEIKIWAEARIDPKGQPWYVVTGQGMGETLTIANQKSAYTLSDRATYVTREGTIQLVILVQGDPALYNLYGVEVVNPAKHPGIKLNTEGAGDFVQFLTSKQGQEMIGAYKVKGIVLFHPNARGETRGMGGK